MTPADEHGVALLLGWSEGLLGYVAVEARDPSSTMVERVARVEL